MAGKSQLELACSILRGVVNKLPLFKWHSYGGSWQTGKTNPLCQVSVPHCWGYIVTSLLALMATPVDVGLEGQKMTHTMCASGQRREPTIEKPHRDEPGVMSMRKSSLRRNARVDRQNETRQKGRSLSLPTSPFLSPYKQERLEEDEEETQEEEAGLEEKG